MLGKSRQSIHERAERGTLKGAQVGKLWVFRRAVIEAELAP